MRSEQRLLTAQLMKRSKVGCTIFSYQYIIIWRVLFMEAEHCGINMERKPYITFHFGLRYVLPLFILRITSVSKGLAFDSEQFVDLP